MLPLQHLLVVLLLVVARRESFAAAQLADVDVCSTAPDALTAYAGRSIPRTCIDVPFADGSGVTTMVSRCYYTYVPDNDRCAAQFAAAPVPVVFDVHGLGSCALLSMTYTGWRELADRDCFVVVWPSGNTDDTLGACFNFEGGLQSESYGEDLMTPPCCCLDISSAERTLNDPKPDDALFIRMAIDAVAEDVGADPTNDASIDRSRVYMAGHSNGCIASLAVAALHSDVVAAVCCHAGAVVTPFDAAAASYDAVPIWMVHGRLDDTILFNGVPFIPPFLPPDPRGFWPVMDTLDYLSEVNGCADAESYDLEGSPESDDYDALDDGNATTTTKGTVFRRTGCANGADVHLLALDDADHVPYPTRNEEGDVVAGFDTTAMAWDFCRAHTMSSSSSSSPDGDTGEPETANDEMPQPAEKDATAAAAEDPPVGESSGSIPRGVSALWQMALAVPFALAAIS